MKILVTGAAGMVGSELCPELARQGHEVVATDAMAASSGVLALDISDRQAAEQTIARVRPDVVIHLAAETDVDRCELEPAHAYRVNAAGTEHVAAACRAAGARLLYVSTAGVFDGKKRTPYVETDAPNPINVYGRTKLAGEVAVRQFGGFWQIVRASWMVGGYPRDKKFVGKLLRLLEERRELSVVTDKTGTLTFTSDLSRGITGLLATSHSGIFHMANAGTCSRYDVAAKMIELLALRDVALKPITSDAFPLPAPRADSEAIESQRLASLGVACLPHWEASLAHYLDRYRSARACASSS